MRLLSRLFHRKLTKKRFVQLMIRSLSEAGATDLRYNDAEFAIMIGSHQANLGNAFADCRDADEARRREIIRNHVAAALHRQVIPASFEPIRSNLLPIIRDPAYMGSFRLKLLLSGKTTEGKEIVYKYIADQLAVSLACDSERTITSVNVGMLRDWGVSLDEAIAVAKDNLRDRTDPTGWVQQRPGTFLACWNDSYDCSRILLTEYIHRLPVDGDPVLFAANREKVWITGSSDLVGLSDVLQAGNKSHFEESYPISPNLYRLRDQTWSLYVPEEPALRELSISIRRDRAAVDYHQQAKDLDALYEKNQTDIFVASYGMLEQQVNGQSVKARVSACAWTRGVESLLPKTEKIVFVVDVETKDTITLPWEAAVNVVGHLMAKVSDLLPVRYHVRTFPGDRQIAELRQLAAKQSDDGHF